MIEPDGYHVYEAANGEEGLDIVKSGKPIDLVITDLLMPEKDGIETLFELKQKKNDLKIILISGGGRLHPKKYLRFAIELGATATLEKPFTSNELLATIKDVLAIV
jgi:YesN/AraC family two-component response regulator